MDMLPSVALAGLAGLTNLYLGRNQITIVGTNAFAGTAFNGWAQPTPPVLQFFGNPTFCDMVRSNVQSFDFPTYSVQCVCAAGLTNVITGCLPDCGLQLPVDPAIVSYSCNSTLYTGPPCNVSCANGFRGGSTLYTCARDGQWQGNLYCSPKLLYNTPAYGLQGRALRGVVPHIEGGSAPFVFAVAGSLPDGLTLNTSSGELGGTPADSGNYSVAVTVTDQLNTTDTFMLSLAIFPSLSVSWLGKPIATVGGLYTGYPVVVRGGSGLFRFSSGPLPSGLSLDVGTGVVSGVPLVQGNYSISLALVDSVVQLGQDVGQYMLAVSPPLVQRATVITLTQNTLYTGLQPTLLGGLGPYVSESAPAERCH